ncbi:MAG: SHOCT domain-containing protein [Actinomycetota bacterium]
MQRTEEVFEMVETLLAEVAFRDGVGGWWFLFFPWIWIALIVGAFFVFRGRRSRWHTHSAEEVLGERYAKGEITAEEYQQRLDVLRRTGK